MRICKIDENEVELTTSIWLSKGKPKVVGCSNLQVQDPFKAIDWSRDIEDINIQLSKDYTLLQRLSEYIHSQSKHRNHHHSSYSLTFKMQSVLLDWAFDCGWTGELDNLKEEVDETDVLTISEIKEEIEELDAPTDIGIDLNKLKFLQNDKGRTQRKNPKKQRIKGEEARTLSDARHSTVGQGEGVSLPEKGRAKKGS